MSFTIYQTYPKFLSFNTLINWHKDWIRLIIIVIIIIWPNRYRHEFVSLQITFGFKNQYG